MSIENVYDLVTVKKFALMCKCTVSNIYKLNKESKLDLVVIDGVCFVNKKKNEIFAIKKLVKKLKTVIKNEQKHNIVKKPSV